MLIVLYVDLRGIRINEVPCGPEKYELPRLNLERHSSPLQ